MTTTATYPRSQHWTTDGFRFSVLLYATSREPCATCGKRPAHHAAWATGRGDREGWSSPPLHFCDEDRPAKGTCPDLPYERITWGGMDGTQYERLHPVPSWPCGECGDPSVSRRVSRCTGCGDEARRTTTLTRTTLTADGPVGRGTERVHALHQTGEWFRCSRHPFPARPS